MNGVLGRVAALQGYTGPRTTWADAMNFVMNHGPSPPPTKTDPKQTNKQTFRIVTAVPDNRTCCA